MIFPQGLKKGDRIAIISPSSPVKEEFIDRAAEFFLSKGFDPVIMPFAKGPAVGSYAASAENRLNDFISAWQDESVRAILCSRGGYGAIHLLQHLPADFLRKDPKWVIGYSDISALHALLLNAGIASVHSPMAKHISEEGDNDRAVKALMRILDDNFPIEYSVPSSAFNIEGETQGILVGGNLAVLNGLFGTD